MTEAAKQLVKHFESLHDGDLKTIGLQPKLCPAGVWTEGYGRVIVDKKTGLPLRGISNRARAYEMSSIKSAQQAETFLEIDFVKKGEEPARRKLMYAYWDKLNENQKSALASFVYNCGTGNPEYRIFRNVRSFLDGKMSEKALAEYWANSVVKANGRTLAGLQRRRKSEAILFLKNIVNFEPDKIWKTLFTEKGAV